MRGAGICLGQFQGREMTGMGSHQSGLMESDTWLTPPHILDAHGQFDLDPCAAINQPWETASNHYTAADNGLSKPWHGRVWCNPPYGRETGKWLARLADHGSGTALIFARTETEMFFEYVWNRACAVLFIEGRLYFHRIDGKPARANAGAPSVLVAYGDYDSEILATAAFTGTIPGKFILLRRVA